MAVEARGCAAVVDPTTNACSISAIGLTKRFGAAWALRGATLRLPQRGVVGILGPNGAGKTTLIRMLAGVLAPDEGELVVDGIDARIDPRAARASVGYLPESAPLYPELTVREYLKFRADLAGVPRAQREHNIANSMEQADVASFGHRCCGTLSKGMQQRVGLAAAILAQPRILILDEPSVGLDPAQALRFRALVRELGDTRLVLLSSHLLSEVESVCAQIVVIAHGRVLAHESMSAFRARALEGSSYSVESDRPFAIDSAISAVCTSITQSTMADGWTRTIFSAPPTSDAREVFARAAMREGIIVRALERADTSLESVFVALVHAAASSSSSSNASLDSSVDASTRREVDA